LPDVLIVDWQLRDDFDGFDVTNKLRETIPNLSTILITGYPAPNLEPKAMGSQIKAVLYKPFSVEDLREAVRKATV
jgi:CheY-like chemotaxis protein